MNRRTFIKACAAFMVLPVSSKADNVCHNLSDHLMPTGDFIYGNSYEQLAADLGSFNYASTREVINNISRSMQLDIVSLKRYGVSLVEQVN